MEVRLQFQNAAERSKTRSIRVCAGQLPARTGPVYSTSVRFLASTIPSLPQYSPSASPFLDSPPRHLIGHGGGIRIVISNRATTHEPLPCRSKFVNGLRIPGLPARTKNPSRTVPCRICMIRATEALCLARLLSYFGFYRHGIFASTSLSLFSKVMFLVLRHKDIPPYYSFFM